MHRTAWTVLFAAILGMPAAGAAGPGGAKGSPIMKVHRQADSVVIEGYETAGWGGAHARTNSPMATLEEVARACGADADYTFLMGAGGSAFRVQIFKDAFCPSSPHPACGFNCIEPAVAAMPFGLRWIETGEGKNEAGVRQAREAIVATVERGIPAIVASEENGLAVGYERGGEVILVRRYAAGKDGYAPMRNWPWVVGVVVEKAGPAPSRRDVFLHSLRQAVEMAGTPVAKDGKYHCGFAAYEAWAAMLADEARTKDGLHGNAWTYVCLLDARTHAVKYLRRMAPEVGPKARPHVRKAAAAYARVVRKLGDPCKVAPGPWSLKPGESWTSEQRARQAAILRECLAIERGAIAEIEKALAAETAP